MGNADHSRATEGDALSPHWRLRLRNCSRGVPVVVAEKTTDAKADPLAFVDLSVRNRQVRLRGGRS